MKQFNLPDPGEGLVEAEIVTWHVKAGDTVKVNDVVVEIETSKSLVELPIPWAGTVTEVLVPEGETVEVGTPIIVIDDGSGGTATPAQPDAAATAGSAASGSAEAETEERVPNLVGYGPSAGSTRRRPRKSATGKDLSATVAHDQVSDVFDASAPVGRPADEREPLPAEPAEPVGSPLPGPGEPPAVGHSEVARTKVLAKPPVRKYAKDHGIDLTEVAGSGAGGIITRADVEEHLAGKENQAVGVAAAASPAIAAGAGDTRIPIKGVRKVTAKAMVDSAFTAPHVTEWVTCDVTALMELVDRLKQRREFRDVKVSPLLVVAKACILALGRHRELNTSWDEDAQEIIYRGQVNLGIAAATPRGLMVPNIKGAESLSLLELAQSIGELVSVAKQGRTQPADMSGGTFTITNVGVFGVDAGTPILNAGEAAILCMGSIDRRPWVVGTGADERIEPRWVTTLAVSFDHRLVDGEQGSKFLAEVAGLLSDPSLAMLF